ncbi:hypothetical protein PFISCL1PPCAC_21527, partial [Pristionchus fissidentatus]
NSDECATRFIHSCLINLSTSRGLRPSKSHLLECGHVICSGCRINYASDSGQVHCRVCSCYVDCMLASSNKAKSHAAVRKPKKTDQIARRCEHIDPIGELQCPCGEVL